MAVVCRGRLTLQPAPALSGYDRQGTSRQAWWLSGRMDHGYAMGEYRYLVRVKLAGCERVEEVG